MDTSIRERAPRLQLKSFLAVQDLASAAALGRLVDLSLSGMMLICTRELPVGQAFELEITLPRSYDTAALRLQAESVWCRNNPKNPAHFGVGFRFSNITAPTLTLLEKLMGEPGALH